MFSIVLDMVTILVMVPIAVAKQHHQKKLGEEIFFISSCTQTSQFIIKGSQVSNTRQEPEGRSDASFFCTIYGHKTKSGLTLSGLGPST